MPTERLSMRKIREVLRLRWERNVSFRDIARACSMGCTTVHDTLERAEKAGLSWPLNEELDDVGLEQLLYPPGTDNLAQSRPLPDWSSIHRELKRKGVTLVLLWQEYKSAYPEGYQYTQFCELYRGWTGHIEPVMRQKHKAGEKLFVDYAGQTIPVTDPVNGCVREVQLFVAVLGASNYTYAEATWTQSLPDWIGSHVRAFLFYGGVPQILVPDNLKSGVNHPCRYDPEINRTYQDLADYYDVSVLPARSRKPRDKAKVENAVLIAERSILAPLRNLQFFDLISLNDSIKEQLLLLNNRPFQNIAGSRCSLFEELERGALQPLPPAAYEFAQWKKALISSDYHVEVEGHHYSVPYRLIGQKLDIRYTSMTVELFHRGNRVASHPRSSLRGEAATLREHMPPSHQLYMDVTPEKILERAGQIGPEVASLIKGMLDGRKHPQLALRSCLGIVRLAKEYGEERLCAASRRALAINASSYRSVQSILKTGLDRAPLPEPLDRTPPLPHENLRGPRYFNR